jgi:hypothetical protein
MSDDSLLETASPVSSENRSLPVLKSDRRLRTFVTASQYGHLPGVLGEQPLAAILWIGINFRSRTTIYQYFQINRYAASTEGLWRIVLLLRQIDAVLRHFIWRIIVFAPKKQ